MPSINISSTGTTEVRPHSLDNAVLGNVAPSPRVVAQGDHHPQPPERLFIGPMPINLVMVPKSKLAREPGYPKKHWWLSLRERGRDGGDSDEDSEDNVPEGHAFRYFLHRGGAKEDWGSEESLKKKTKREMLRHLRESGWSPLTHSTKKGQPQRKNWVGETFQIGTDFFGIPLQADSQSTAAVNDAAPNLDGSTSELAAAISGTFSTETFHTALEQPTQSTSVGSLTPNSSGDLHNHQSISNESGTALLPPAVPSAGASLPRLLSLTSSSSKAFSDGHILSSNRRQKHSDVRTIISDSASLPTSRPNVPLRSAIRHLREDGNAKSVQFSSIPPQQIQPVPPSEVLARPSSYEPETSAGAAAAQQQESERAESAVDFKYGDVIRKDRMLVRRSHVKTSTIGPYFDEHDALKLRDFRSQEWKEFLVVWRMDQLELYEDYAIPGKESMLGHKHLAYIIPLSIPATRVSLYSFVDLTFCLSCTMLKHPKPMTRTASNIVSRLHQPRGSGTDVFVFKAKTRTTGVDWIWEIWRQLGNKIPPTFEVYCPATESRVRLHVPDYDNTGHEALRIFTRNHVIDVCRRAMKNMSSWDYLIEEPMRNGAHLELAWRRGVMLDWIIYETDVDGDQRYWAALYGLCLRKPGKITHLEARIAEHRPSTVLLKDGTRLCDPPTVEGYVWRIKPNSSIRTQVYLSTHGGCLFSINPNRAHPPRPPIPITDDAQPSEPDDARLPFRDREIQRGAQQILQANGFVDLRSIIAVRRAFQIAVPLRHQENYRDGQGNMHSSIDTTQRQEEDDADYGGEEALARHPDKPTLRMRRSFELLMRTGHVVRFEAYSCKVAVEWINHLGNLVEYWTLRHRVDARQEMDLIHSISGNPEVILGNPGENVAPPRPPDYDDASDYLPIFWNWCVLEECRSVIRNGLLFLRRGLHGQYKLMQLVLVSGHLVQFHITRGALHHHRSKTTSLLDAYVCSGNFATQSLPANEISTIEEPLPRRFQDGLENADYDAETVLIIWYRPHAIGQTNAQAKVSTQPTVPSLKAKHKIIVLKARSKLERDAWCWALNAEIERTSRRLSDREKKARKGNLVKL